MNTWRGMKGLYWSLMTLERDNRPDWLRNLDVHFIEVNGKERYFNIICRLRYNKKYGSHASSYYEKKEGKKAEEEALFESWQKN